MLDREDPPTPDAEALAVGSLPSPFPPRVAEDDADAAAPRAQRLKQALFRRRRRWFLILSAMTVLLIAPSVGTALPMAFLPLALLLWWTHETSRPLVTSAVWDAVFAWTVRILTVTPYAMTLLSVVFVLVVLRGEIRLTAAQEGLLVATVSLGTMAAATAVLTSLLLVRKLGSARERARFRRALAIILPVAGFIWLTGDPVWGPGARSGSYALVLAWLVVLYLRSVTLFLRPVLKAHEPGPLPSVDPTFAPFGP